MRKEGEIEVDEGGVRREGAGEKRELAADECESVHRGSGSDAWLLAHLW